MARPPIAILRPYLLIVTVIAGCDGSSSVTSSSPSPSSVATTATADAAIPAAEPIAELPLTLTVEQRSTTPVPGSDGKLSLTIDTDGNIQPSAEDDEIALKKTYWEAYQQWPREIELEV